MKIPCYGIAGLSGISGSVEDSVPADSGTFCHIIEIFQTGKGFGENHLDLEDLIIHILSRKKRDAVGLECNLFNSHGPGAESHYMANQIQLTAVGVKNPADNRRGICKGLVVGRVYAAALVLFRKRGEGSKIQLQKVLIHVGRGHDGHDTIDNLVCRKQDSMSLVIESHLPECVAPQGHGLKNVIAAAKQLALLHGKAFTYQGKKGYLGMLGCAAFGIRGAAIGAGETAGSSKKWEPTGTAKKETENLHPARSLVYLNKAF